MPDAPREDRGAREQRYRRIQEPGPLEILPNGLEIIRRRKHEPIEFDGLSRQQMKFLTDKVHGSKFAGNWLLVDYVDWVAHAIGVLGWTPATGPADHGFAEGRIVGICKGEPVHTIRIVSDGRNVHAYPAEDA